jgi:hypothetical protein
MDIKDAERGPKKFRMKIKNHKDAKLLGSTKKETSLVTVFPEGVTVGQTRLSPQFCTPKRVCRLGYRITAPLVTVFPKGGYSWTD